MRAIAVWPFVKGDVGIEAVTADRKIRFPPDLAELRMLDLDVNDESLVNPE
jgi:hypothetical protein